MRQTLLLFSIVLSLTCGWAASVAADCSGGAMPTGTECGAISFAGCCSEEQLYFCEAGELCQLPCDKILHCGWNGNKDFYDCETDGMADLDLVFPKECPAFSPADCQGVEVAGCCAGDKLYWCDGIKLQTIDCAANSSKTVCGTNADSGTADCLPPGAPAFMACPFATGDDVTLPDLVSSDSTDSGGSDSAKLSIDGLVVPDLNAPSTCAALATRYEVTATDCEILASVFLTKQEGCAALLVGLVPTAAAHPAAKVTKTGMVFDFLEAGVTRQCTGSIAGEIISGECYWGTSGSCEFSLTAAELRPEEVKPDSVKTGKGSGCQTGAEPGTGSLVWLIVMGLLVVLLRRMSSCNYRCETRLS
jgi:uncharacterized protein (TIGR03382 family)